MTLRHKIIVFGLMSIASYIINGCERSDVKYSGIRVLNKGTIILEAHPFRDQTGYFTILKSKRNQEQLERKLPGKLESLTLNDSKENILAIFEPDALNTNSAQYLGLILDGKTLIPQTKWTLTSKIILTEKNTEIEISRIEMLTWDENTDNLAIGCICKTPNGVKPTLILSNAQTGKVNLVSLIDKPLRVKKTLPQSAPFISKILFSNNGKYLQINGFWIEKAAHGSPAIDFSVYIDLATGSQTIFLDDPDMKIQCAL